MSAAVQLYPDLKPIPGIPAPAPELSESARQEYALSMTKQFINTGLGAAAVTLQLGIKITGPYSPALRAPQGNLFEDRPEISNAASTPSTSESGSFSQNLRMRFAWQEALTSTGFLGTAKAFYEQQQQRFGRQLAYSPSAPTRALTLTP